MSDKDVSDMISTLGKIWDALNDLRVLIAGGYVTKDLAEYKKENDKAHDEIKVATKDPSARAAAPIVAATLTSLAVALITRK